MRPQGYRAPCVPFVLSVELEECAGPEVNLGSLRDVISDTRAPLLYIVSSSA
jgi:hypothetical protein